MDLQDWVHLFLRWTHFIAGIAWIGSSFYFIWLDSHLEAPSREGGRVVGSLWMVHSGGFYQVERRRIGPGEMPGTLHWFQWEAALTWASGLLLLGLVYHATGGLYLIDREVADIDVGAAIGIGLAAIAVSWLAYDRLWNSGLARRRGLAPVLTFVLIAALAFALCRTLSGRAAFLHVGAALGTWMAANVWMRILPAQRQMIAATEAGEQPDLTLGERAKQRSVHNSYLTFPVLFLMLSPHFPATWGHPSNWLVLLLLVVVGAGARHLMIARERSRFWVTAPIVAATVALIAMTAPSPRTVLAPARAAPGDTVSFAEVQAVIVSRCVTCHSERPALETFGPSPGGVAFDRASEIRRLAERIRVRTVETRTMPLGNWTRMTEEERELLARWTAHEAARR